VTILVECNNANAKVYAKEIKLLNLHEWANFTVVHEQIGRNCSLMI